MYKKAVKPPRILADTTLRAVECWPLVFRHSLSPVKTVEFRYRFESIVECAKFNEGEFPMQLSKEVQ